MKRVEITLIGKTPLLMHRDDVESADVLEEIRAEQTSKTRKKAGDDRNPPFTWITYLHEDGEYVAFPSDYFMVALRKAGAAFQIPGQGKLTYKTATQMGIIPETEYMEFSFGSDLDRRLKFSECRKLWNREVEFGDHKKFAEDRGFLLFIKRAKVGQAKHVRVRPRFNHWRAVGTFVVKAEYEVLTEDVVEKLVRLAGEYGFGDWRPNSPQSPGSFGMADVSLKYIR
jgi:hypothetical protein